MLYDVIMSKQIQKAYASESSANPSFPVNFYKSYTSDITQCESVISD